MAHETLSALLDGECSPDEMDALLDEMERSPDLKQAWSRQCLAREAREGTVVGKGQTCICAGVMAALDDLPDEVNPRVVELAARRKSPNIFGWNPLTGLAAAASVAAVALVLSLPARHPDAILEAGSGAVPEATTPVSYPVQRSRDLRAVALHPEEQAQQEELEKLFMEHSGSMAEQGMGGTLRYARFAAHTAEYRPAGDR